MPQLTTSPSWRKVFLVPLIFGTYFYVVILKDEGLKEAGEMKDVGPLEMATAIPAMMLQKLSIGAISRSVMLELFFLNCFGFLLMTLLFYKRRGSTGYIIASFLTNASLGLGLCNYLFPITSLEFQYSMLQHERADVKKNTKKPAPKGKKSPPKKQDLLRHITVPNSNQWAFTVLVFVFLLLIKMFWKMSKHNAAVACMYLPVIYMAIPLALMAGYVAKGQEATMDPAKTKKLMFAWLVAGIALAYHTRIGVGFPVKKLDFTSSTAFQETFTKVFLTPHGGTPYSYLAFAAQLVSFNTTCALYAIVSGALPLPFTLLLLPFFFICPTVATPLYFLFHDFTDHRLAEVEAADANRKKKDN